MSTPELTTVMLYDAEYYPWYLCNKWLCDTIQHTILSLIQCCGCSVVKVVVNSFLTLMIYLVFYYFINHSIVCMQNSVYNLNSHNTLCEYHSLRLYN